MYNIWKYLATISLHFPLFAVLGRESLGSIVLFVEMHIIKNFFMCVYFL